MEWKSEIIGWTIIMKRVVIDYEKVNRKEIEDVDLSSLYKKYYLGKEGKQFLHPPQNPDSLFKSKISATSHIYKKMKDNKEFIISVAPVYKRPVAALADHEVNRWVRPQETFEFQARQRQIAMRKDGFKKYNKEAGKIRKLK